MQDNAVSADSGQKSAPAGTAGTTRPSLVRPAPQRRALLPIVGGLILLLGICTTAAYLGVESRISRAQASRAEQIEMTARDLRERVIDAESGQRGFLVTGRTEYLIRYQDEIAPIADTVEALRRLVAGDVVRVALVNEIGDAVRQKLAEMKQTLAFAKANRMDDARALVNTDLGSSLTGHINGLVGRLERHVDQARDEANDREGRAITGLMTAIGMAAVGAILLSAIALSTLRQQVKLLERREAQLGRLVASLEARVARRTRALADANARFQIALEATRVSVFSQDRDLIYLWAGQGYRNLTPEQIVGCSDSDIFPPEAAAQLTRLKSEVIATGMPARAEVRAESPDGPVTYEMHLVPSLGAGGTVTGVIGAAVDISERKQFEAHVRLLMRELSHRSKNLLAVTQALMRQTAVHANSVDDFVARFTARINALAGAHDLLIKDDWRGTTMEELVRSQLAHYTDRQGTQIDIAGEPLRVPPDATQNIGMALHELATNAAKYGALSVPSGQVRINWTVVTDDGGQKLCRIDWRESNGPLVAPPARRGFGQVVIERTVARAVNGTVCLAYKPTGVEWSLEFPLAP